MTEYEKWYQFCMLCEYAYIRKDDADKVYCSAPKGHCPHKKEIEDAEREERRIRLIDVDVYLKKVCTYNETGCGSCRFQTKCPADEPIIDAESVRYGKWIEIIEINELGEPYQSGVYCSECGHTDCYESNFCPDCGADMRGEE